MIQTGQDLFMDVGVLLNLETYGTSDQNQFEPFRTLGKIGVKFVDKKTLMCKIHLFL